MVKIAAFGRHRGHPRRGLQPHRGGQPPRPDAVLPRHRQRRLLPAGRGRQAVLHGLHRHRQLAERPAPALAAAAHGLAALLGHRDACRRLPFRPRGHAGPGVLRRRPAVHLLRTRAAGPGRLAGEADRRAVGHRPRRLPGRQLPAAVDGVERQVPGHRPRLLARRAGHPRASSPPGSPVRPTSTRHSGRRPVASINFVTAHDGFTLADLVSYNEKHNEANGEGNRDGESHNRSWNCGVEGPTDDAGRARPARPAAAQLPGDTAAVPGRSDDRARRRAGPHPARQQQHLLPGLRAELDPLAGGRRAADRVHRVGGPAAPAAPDLPPAPVLRRPAGRPGRGRAAAGHRLDDPGRRS